MIPLKGDPRTTTYRRLLIPSTMHMTEKRNIHNMVTLVLLITPFYLNDFSNIYVKSWQWWLLIDYAFVKLYPLLLVAWLVKYGKTKLHEIGLKPQPVLAFFIVFIATALIGTILDQNAYKLITKIPGYRALGAMPLIRNPFWNWVDLTFGLLMVAIVEELVFRGYMFAFIREHTSNKPIIVIISSLAFGLIHWSGGLHVVFVTSLIGAVFMIVYIKMRSLPSIMLAHFVVNFIDFSGVIPKSIFKFV